MRNSFSKRAFGVVLVAACLAACAGGGNGDNSGGDTPGSGSGGGSGSDSGGGSDGGSGGGTVEDDVRIIAGTWADEGEIIIIGPDGLYAQFTNPESTRGTTDYDTGVVIGQLFEVEGNELDGEGGTIDVTFRVAAQGDYYKTRRYIDVPEDDPWTGCEPGETPDIEHCFTTDLPNIRGEYTDEVASGDTDPFISGVPADLAISAKTGTATANSEDYIVLPGIAGLVTEDFITDVVGEFDLLGDGAFVVDVDSNGNMTNAGGECYIEGELLPYDDSTSVAYGFVLINCSEDGDVENDISFDGLISVVADEECASGRAMYGVLRSFTEGDGYISFGAACRD